MIIDEARLSPETKAEIEESRKFWNKVAQDNGWYGGSLALQVWLNKDGTVEDSIYISAGVNDVIVQ